MSNEEAITIIEQCKDIDFMYTLCTLTQYDEVLDTAIEALKSRRTGHWIGDKCSVCGEERAWYGCNPLYCPDCGAKMQ